MPWISEDLEEWEELSEEERARLLAMLRELGVELPDDDDDYYE